MSRFPPFSRGGAVWAASAATRGASLVGRWPSRAPSGSGASARRGMGRAGECEAGDGPRGGAPAGERPFRLVGGGEVVAQDATAGAGREAPGVAPALSREGAEHVGGGGPDVHDVDDEESPRPRPVHRERATQLVPVVERCPEDVLCRVVISDGAVEPVAAVHAEGLAGPDGRHRRDLRVPPTVADELLILECAGGVERKYH